MANRTAKGNVTAEARKKTGSKGGKYPIFDQKSCTSAVKLRHHAKGGPSASSTLGRASRWANAHNNAACKKAVRRAREEDQKRND